MRRWVIYQRERFPLAAHAPLIAAFSASAVCFSAIARDAAGPTPAALIVAFATSLLFFLQLRIADEIKDADEDARLRPYRPVPRGLVSIGELAWIGAAAALVQLALAIWLHPPLVRLLALVWIYLALMTREFFAPRWLRAHPIVYAGTHMAILPLIDLYATACDWQVAGAARAPVGLGWFLAVSYWNGVVVEIGRKTRPPVDEEPGVDTYSARWGRDGALRAWLAAIAVAATAAGQAAATIGSGTPMLALLAVAAIGCAAAARQAARATTSGSGRRLEAVSGAWTLAVYICLGTAPLALRGWRP